MSAMTKQGEMQSLTREAVSEFANEYNAIRNDVGLTDCNSWTKLKISGYDARDFLDGILTGNLQQLGENEILHTMALDGDGVFLCDIMVFGGFEDFILLCPEAQADNIQAALSTGEGTEFEIADLTQDYCLIRADGPNSADLPMAILGGAVSGLRIMAFAEAELEGFTITVGRVGTTGEYGFFFLAEAKCQGELLAAIRAEAPQAPDCPAILHDLLQLETRGFSAARDLPNGEHPLEAGLHWMGDFHKPEFTGRDGFFAAAGEVTNQLVCIRLHEGTDVPETGAAILDDNGNGLGYVAQAGWSPELETAICLGYLQRDWAAVGLPVVINGHPGQVVSAPFFVTKSNSARSRPAY